MNAASKHTAFPNPLKQSDKYSSTFRIGSASVVSIDGRCVVCDRFGEKDDGWPGEEGTGEEENPRERGERASDPASESTDGPRPAFDRFLSRGLTLCVAPILEEDFDEVEDEASPIEERSRESLVLRRTSVVAEEELLTTLEDLRVDTALGTPLTARRVSLGLSSATGVAATCPRVRLIPAVGCATTGGVKSEAEEDAAGLVSLNSGLFWP